MTAVPLAGGAVLLLLASSVTIGADTMWFVAMGDWIARHRGLPTGIPFAAADSSGWPNVPVLGELAFAGLHALGPLGLPAAQLVVDAVVLAVLAVDARRLGAGQRATAAVLVVAAAGALPALGIVRAQLLSLVPFALLALLLRAEHRTPSRRVWLVPVLVAAWGNVHGAVLVGVALAGCHLLLSRLRREPGVAVAVGLATLAALWLNPAGLRTGAYYVGALGNEAARRRSELWASPDLGQPFDLLLVAAALLLLGLAVAARGPLWEQVALAGLAVATTTSARHGVWLVLLAAPPAAAGWSALRRGRAGRHGSFGPGRPVRAPSRRRAAAVTVVLALLTAGLLLSRRDAFSSSDPVVSTVHRVAGSRVVLAPEPLAESLAVAGVTLWMSNPIDAFSPADQAAYLDFVSGSGPSARRAIDAARVVVARSGSPPRALLSERDFVVVARVEGYDVLERRP